LAVDGRVGVARDAADLLVAVTLRSEQEAAHLLGLQPPQGLGAELETLRWELRLEGDVRPSRSEIAEAALRIAVEDVRERGEESELSRRLGGRHVARISDAAGGTTRRSVDEAGWIFETTYDENGEIIDEDVVGTVADLPVMDEYVDEQGRLVSVAKDELGNTFEQIMDEGFNTLGTRLLRTRDQDAR